MISLRFPLCKVKHAAVGFNLIVNRNSVISFAFQEHPSLGFKKNLHFSKISKILKIQKKKSSSLTQLDWTLFPRRFALQFRGLNFLGRLCVH